MPYANMARDENNGLPLCRQAVKKFLSGPRSRRRGLKKRPGGARKVGLTSRTAEEQLVERGRSEIRAGLGDRIADFDFRLPLLLPVGAVEGAVLDGFRNMAGLDLIAP